MTNQIDTAAVTELVLFIENTAELMAPGNTRGAAIRANLARKVKAGKYDASKAVTLWAYLAEDGAKLYVKEMGGVWHQVFPVAVRKAVAARLEASQLEVINNLAAVL